MLSIGGHSIVKDVNISPWNKGYIINTMVVKRGDTKVINIAFPSKKPGNYKGSIRITHSYMDKGKLKTKIYKGALQIKVRKSGIKLYLSINGSIVIDGKKNRIIGTCW